jgi:hypothetical protein
MIKTSVALLYVQMFDLQGHIVLDFRFGLFEFVSHFGFRVSDLMPLYSCKTTPST